MIMIVSVRCVGVAGAEPAGRRIGGVDARCELSCAGDEEVLRRCVARIGLARTSPSVVGRGVRRRGRGAVAAEGSVGGAVATCVVGGVVSSVTTLRSPTRPFIQNTTAASTRQVTTMAQLTIRTSALRPGVPGVGGASRRHGLAGAIAHDVSTPTVRRRPCVRAAPRPWCRSAPSPTSRSASGGALPHAAAGQRLTELFVGLHLEHRCCRTSSGSRGSRCCRRLGPWRTGPCTSSGCSGCRWCRCTSSATTRCTCPATASPKRPETRCVLTTALFSSTAHTRICALRVDDSPTGARVGGQRHLGGWRGRWCRRPGRSLPVRPAAASAVGGQLDAAAAERRGAGPPVGVVVGRRRRDRGRRRSSPAMVVVVVSAVEVAVEDSLDRTSPRAVAAPPTVAGRGEERRQQPRSHRRS